MIRTSALRERQSRTTFRLADGSEVRAITDEAHAAQLTREAVTAAVHYVRFELTPEQREIQGLARDLNSARAAGDAKTAQWRANELVALGNVLGILTVDPEQWFRLGVPRAGVEGAMDDDAIDSLIEARLAARRAKNWAESDRIRNGGANHTLPRGTVIKSIRLTGDPQEIDCRHDTIKGLVLRAEFVRKR